MNEVLTWEEIEHRYPDEWVLLVDQIFGERFPLTAGRVVAHTQDREAVERAARQLGPQRHGVFFTGALVDPGSIPMLLARGSFRTPRSEQLY
jgi:hypothetical protein